MRRFALWKRWRAELALGAPGQPGRLLLACLLVVSSLADPSRLSAQDSPPASERAGGAVDSSKLFGDKILARGNGVEVRRSDVEKAFLLFRANLAARGERFDEDRRSAVEAQLLDRLIVTQLLTGRAVDEDRQAAVGSAERVIAKAKADAGTEGNFQHQLNLVGMSSAEFEAEMLERAICEEVINRELRAGIAIGPELVRARYDSDPARFREKEAASVQHILLLTRYSGGKEMDGESIAQQKAKATAVLKKVRAGADFTELVRTYSEDVVSRDRGGEYRFFRGNMPIEFEAATFALRPGQVSGLVTTRFGFHIIKLNQRFPSRQRSLPEVQGEVEEALLVQEVERRLPEYLDKLKSEANVTLPAEPQTGR